MTLTTDYGSDLHIYAENTKGRDPAYNVTEEMVHQVFAEAGLEPPASITVAFADERDSAAWSQADVLIAGRLDKQAIPEMAALRLIQCTSAGVEGYMPADWLATDVILTNASGVHAEKVREFGAMAVLMLHEHIPARMTVQAQGQWLRTLRPASRGKRVLVYGAGALGGAVAQGLSGFGFTLVGIGRDATAIRPEFNESYGPDALEAELARADILVIAAPLTAETRGRFDMRTLQLLPQGAAVLNIGRGPVLDTEALAALLRNGHLSGAILDVFNTEPLPATDPLWQVPNLLITPHVSADDPSHYARNCVAILARNILAASQGLPLQNVVDRSLGY